LRLVILRSTVLPKKQAAAVLDGYEEGQIGRDAAPAGSETPRIRLKEMEVSKYHANVYWDSERRQWAVVDMGSKHGTFLRSSSSSFASSSLAGPEERGIRLSPPRVASMPKALHHLDQLSIGGTTFLVHLHEDGLPCADCALHERAEVPLFAVPKKRKREESSVPVNEPGLQPKQQHDPRKALSSLKRSLLHRHDDSTSSSRFSTPSAPYVDRSARRRALHATSASETPGVMPPPLQKAASAAQSAVVDPNPNPLPEPVSAPPTPLSSSNIGHKLLMKQGWQPGTSLGQAESEGTALIEPLQVAISKNRAGLGMAAVEGQSTPNETGVDWRDTARRRRFEDLR
ncbi:hypothetical protein OE88DRAFT_1597609, partial [Heliocybe sulcata]